MIGKELSVLATVGGGMDHVIAVDLDTIADKHVVNTVAAPAVRLILGKQVIVGRSTIRAVHRCVCGKEDLCGKGQTFGQPFDNPYCRAYGRRKIRFNGRALF